MRHLKLITLLFTSLFLFGCASSAKMHNMAYMGLATENKNFDSSLNKSINVKESVGGKETNPAWTSEISNKEFTGAVKLSLSSRGLYSEKGRYKLGIHMIEVDQPMLGFDMTVTTHTRYTLVDSETGKVVFEETVIAPYTATIGDAFIGSERLKLANEGSGKENIKKMIEKLSGLKIKANDIAIAE